MKLNNLKQKFQKGDFVRVAKDLGPAMSHFTSDCDAIVLGSYADQYGGKNITSFTIHIKAEGRVAWYEEHQLTLIEPNRIDMLEIWEREAKEEERMKSDLDWIFENGQNVLKEPHGATLIELGRHLGCPNLWGNSGEGFVYARNAIAILRVAEPFLIAGDKQGYLDTCKNYE